MKGDPKVIEFLNDGLRHELTSINQYWLHYRLLANWGLEKLAGKWRQELIEEMRHADRLMERIIFLDGMPNMQNSRTPARRAHCQGVDRERPRDRDDGTHALCRCRGSLPDGEGSGDARSIRRAYAERGAAHRLPRNPARPDCPARR